jgi:hypothetical protein
MLIIKAQPHFLIDPSPVIVPDAGVNMQRVPIAPFEIQM